MADCISEYNFDLYIDPYDFRNALIGDTDGTVVATVNRVAFRHSDGLAIARLLRAAPAMLRALEVALNAYSPNSHLLGIACNTEQSRAASTMRDAIGLALYGIEGELNKKPARLQPAVLQAERCSG